MDIEARKLAALKDDLRRDLEAIERVERMMAFKNGSLSPRPNERQVVLNIYDPEAAKDDDETAVEAGSLRSKIEQIVNDAPDTRWTTQKVLAHLQSINYPLRAKAPIYSVGQTLNVLARKGKIRI
ncbi:MAG: hypothetical protein ACREIC_27720, partial [Limisphaerales bacterium]